MTKTVPKGATANPAERNIYLDGEESEGDNRNKVIVYILMELQGA